MITRAYMRKIWRLADAIDKVISEARDTDDAMRRLARLRAKVGDADFKLAYEVSQKTCEQQETPDVNDDAN